VPKIPAKNLAGVSYLKPECPPSFIEAIRGLRGSLVLTAAQREAKVVLVTSTTAGEGKSTLSLNLAQATAETGLKTLLIDADLRRGTVAERLGIAANTPGLADIIRGERVARLPDQESAARLHGSHRRNAASHRGGPVAARIPHEMLAKAREEYDLIIFDAPPLMPVRDADTILTFAERVVFVVKIRGAALDAAERSLLVVKRLAKVEPLLVVNQASTRDGSGYYHYYYDAYR
jgi:Mrp family chromosome partitioning ATPase